MDNFYIDDITWNDLNMDDVLSKIDKASSSVGTEYAKKALKSLLFDEKALKARSGRADYFNDNKEEAGRLKKIFASLGRTKKVSFYDYIFRLKEVPDRSNIVHYILILLLILSVCLIFIMPALGIIALVVMISVNIALYFKMRSAVEGYFLCLKYLIAMINAAGAVLKKAPLKNDAFDEIRADLASSVKELKDLKRFSWLLTNSVSGSLTDVIMDYIRMIFHVDLIRFNRMKKKAMGHEAEINRLYNALGELELDMSLAAFRGALSYYCLPEFEKTSAVEARDIYHPLIDGPVSNSINAEKSVLFTGSNASGKSTFLKTLALSQIFAQTLCTCPAHSYKTGFYKVFSSMALSDNLLGKESYFVVEIKSLKRIFDGLGDVPVICFIDEVLRGTNTKERIAASSQILKNLSQSNALVFAATHDIELTRILEGCMENLHFSEKIDESEVVFDYKIKEGPADTRNAIRLLEVYGFDKKITEEALKMCLP